MNTVQTKATVEDIVPLTDSIFKLILKPKHYVDYVAGQYLKINTMTNEWLPFSIANAALGSHHYELHIRHIPDSPFALRLFPLIQSKGEVIIELPFGNCHAKQLAPDTPIVFITGGTGFAPVKAMIEQLLATSDPRPFELYWGARSESDLYLDEMVRQWKAHVRHFNYYASLPKAMSNQTLLKKVIARHPKDLATHQLILNGPFPMVFSLRDQLLQHGVPKHCLLSDAFEFEKQEY